MQLAGPTIVTHGDDEYEFNYGNYDDYNNPLNLIEVYMAGSITESKNGEVLRELNTAVFAVSGITSVEYRVEGSCESFSEWLQYGGCLTYDRDSQE